MRQTPISRPMIKRTTYDVLLMVDNIPCSLIYPSVSDTYVEITNLWSAIPEALRSVGTLKSFKRDLKNFFFSRLQMVFEGDNVKTYKIVCPKCRQTNPLRVCSC